MKAIGLAHRWLGIIACLAILMFAGSGILHPVMSRFQPKPAQFMPFRVEMPATALSLRAVLQQHAITDFSTATLINTGSEIAYRVQIDASRARYFNAENTQEITAGEQRQAEFLARYYLGDERAAITHIELISAFDDDYVFINRLLPVWRVDFARADGMRVYVDTAGNRLATLSDNPKRVFQTYFRTLHNFDFLRNHQSTRVMLMLVLLISTMATAAMGLVMYARLKRADIRLQRLSARRWHRRLSLAIAAATFSFTVSGTWHLLQSQIEPPPSPTNRSSHFQTDELGDAQVPGAFTLLRINDQPCWRVSAAPARNRNVEAEHEHHHPLPAASAIKTGAPACIDTQSGQPIANAEAALAENLARFYSDDKSTPAVIEPIAQFDGEYGFINKRLPVWKLQFADSETHWYVETSSGALALRADKAAALEGWIFSIFHKARFIGDDYKNARDGLLMLFAFGNIVVALLGLWVFIRQLRRPALTLTVSRRERGLNQSSL